MDNDNTQDGAEPSLASAGSVAHPLEQILRGTVRLHELIQQGRCDSDEADAVRDEMDVPFWKLSESEREAARLVSAAIKDREWIPVTERLPEEGQRVLVYEKLELIVVAELSRSVSGGLWWSTDNGHTAYSVFPTHWMPLPAPPTDGK